jgi:hypothetical protein
MADKQPTDRTTVRSRTTAVLALGGAIVAGIVLAVVFSTPSPAVSPAGKAGDTVLTALANDTTVAAPTATVPATPTPRQHAEAVYLALLDEYGIQYASDPAAVGTGYAICDYLTTGTTPLNAMDIIREHGGYDWMQAAQIVGSAHGTLCVLAGDR